MYYLLHRYCILELATRMPSRHLLLPNTVGSRLSWPRILRWVSQTRPLSFLRWTPLGRYAMRKSYHWIVMYSGSGTNNYTLRCLFWRLLMVLFLKAMLLHAMVHMSLMPYLFRCNSFLIFCGWQPCFCFSLSCSLEGWQSSFGVFAYWTSEWFIKC